MAAPQLGETLPVPTLRFMYSSVVHIAAPMVVGNTPGGLRRIINITGGSFSGPQMSGKVLPGGADWQVIRPDAITELEAKYTLETDDGALIYVTNWGLRHGPAAVIERLQSGAEVDPSEYYFRTTPKFETGSAKYAWLHGLVCVATGARWADRVMIDVYSVT